MLRPHHQFLTAFQQQQPAKLHFMSASLSADGLVTWPQVIASEASGATQTNPWCRTPGIFPWGHMKRWGAAWVAAGTSVCISVACMSVQSTLSSCQAQVSKFITGDEEQCIMFGLGLLLLALEGLGDHAGTCCPRSSDALMPVLLKS